MTSKTRRPAISVKEHRQCRVANSQQLLFVHLHSLSTHIQSRFTTVISPFLLDHHANALPSALTYTLSHSLHHLPAWLRTKPSPLSYNDGKDFTCMNSWVFPCLKSSEAIQAKRVAYIVHVPCISQRRAELTMGHLFLPWGAQTARARAPTPPHFWWASATVRNSCAQSWWSKTTNALHRSVMPHPVRSCLCQHVSNIYMHIYIYITRS